MTLIITKVRKSLKRKVLGKGMFMGGDIVVPPFSDKLKNVS